MRTLSEKSGSEKKVDLESTGKKSQSQIASVTVKEGNPCSLPLFSIMLSSFNPRAGCVDQKRE